jgi:hypothetical protein
VLAEGEELDSNILQLETDVRFSPEADKKASPTDVRFVPILLQKSLMVLANSDSVALIRFAAESGDDGAAQSRPRSAVLLVLS